LASLREIQTEHAAWIRRNFPDQTPEQVFMGMAEELGEFAHARLKHQQGIREIDDGNVQELMIDALCDLWIFSLSMFDFLGIDATDALSMTWDRVKKRDWVDDPQKGGES
jgi:NTP pyrophosphatase (non-canonical NTP hydrolase)